MRRWKDILYRLNPVAKIIIMVALVIPVTFSKDVYYPALLLALIGATGYFFGGFTPLYMLKKLRIVLFAAFCLFLFLVVTRGIGQLGDIQIGMIGMKYSDMTMALSLALRMMGFAYGALLFTESTDPVILVISLIKIWKLPYRAGYAFLVAYRFVPAFGEEMRKIRVAREVRSANSKRVALPEMFRGPGYLFLMLVNAIRSGERVAISMDVRAFGIAEERTYFKEVNFGKLERSAIAISIGALVVFTGIMVVTGLFKFTIGFAGSGIA